MLRTTILTALLLAQIGVPARAAETPPVPSRAEVAEVCQRVLAKLREPKFGVDSYYIGAYIVRNGVRLADRIGDLDTVRIIADKAGKARAEYSELSGEKLRDGDRGPIPTVFINIGEALDDQAWLDLGLRLATERFDGTPKMDEDQVAQWMNSGEWPRGKPPGKSLDQCAITTCVVTDLYRHRPQVARPFLDYVVYFMLGTHARHWQPDRGILTHNLQNTATTWGRGNGWYMVGLTEVLQVLPSDHRGYDEMRRIHREFSDGLLRHQRPSGAWGNLVDLPSTGDESSGTGMFLCGLARGVKEGWYEDPAPYAAAAHKAWRFLVSAINDKGSVDHVCPGMGGTSDLEKYTSKTLDSNGHGLLAFFWGARAYYDMLPE